MSPSRSWQRITPQATFVNGRGNVQLPGAAKQYVPVGSSAGSPGNGSASPVVGVQRQGQQMYVRGDSSVPMGRRPSEGGGSLDGSGAGGETAAVYLPNQFGVRQRVAIKTSSRPQAPRTPSIASTATGPRRSSAVSTVSTIEAASPGGSTTPTAATPTGPFPPTRPEDRATVPAYPPLSVPSSRSNSLQPPSPYASVASGSTTPTSARSPSPSPSARSGKTSILDRPRPRASDARNDDSSVSSFASRHAGHVNGFSQPSSQPISPSASTFTSASVLDRPRPRTPDPSEPFRSASPAVSVPSLGDDATPSTALLPAKTSVLDRPRPKTPETGAVFRFGEARGGATGGSRPRTPDSTSVFNFNAGGSADSSSVLDRPRPKTPDSSSVFAFNAPSPSTAPGVESAEAAAPATKRSMLDRPRPRTPDSQAWLDTASTVRGAPKPFGSTSPSYQQHQHSPSAPGRFFGAHHHRTPGSGTTTSGFSSSKGGSFDSLGRTALSASTPASTTTATSVRPSLDSSYSAASMNRLYDPAPLLDFSFDFGNAFGSTETMFGLSDLLKSSSGAADEEDKGSATPKPSPNAFQPSPSAVQPALSAEPPLHARTPSNTSHSSSFLGAPLGGPNGRTTPRKEPPKVDLKLELELEMERAIPPNRPIVAPDEGGRLVREQASMSSIGSSTAASTSISGCSGFGTAGAAGTGASPKPKRRRRRSLASLLSLGSFSQSGHGHGEPEEVASEREKRLDKGKGKERERGAEMEEDERARKVPASGPAATSASVPRPGPALGAMRLVQPSSTSLVPPVGRLSLDKSLPPTPVGVSPLPPASPSRATFDTAAPPPPDDSPSKRSFGAAVDGASKGLGRQLSRLRNRNATSPDATRSRNPNFQVLSATTTRRRSHERKASVSSLGTADTHASMRRKSTEFGQHPSPAPFVSTFPSSIAPGAAVAEPVLAPSAPAPSPASTSVPFGRRLVERFSKNSGSKQIAPTAQADSWTMPVRDHSAEPKPRLGRRRASLSSLLGVGSSSASADGHGGASTSGATAPKRILGMSLPAGRKSEDLLTSGRMRGPERDMRREWESGTLPQEQKEPQASGFDGTQRRSFDLLTDRSAVPRRPSTDDLLALASAKLSKMGLSTETTGSSAQPSTAESAHASALSSGISTPVEEPTDKPVIAHATFVNRVEGGTGAAQQPTSLSEASTVMPPKQPVPPTVEPIWARPQTAQVTPAPLASRMTQDWHEIEEALHAYVSLVRENRSDRGYVVSNTLLPFLRREEDHPSPQAVDALAKHQRALLFDWLNILTTELTDLQPSHRGACLDAVAGIAESHILSIAALQDDKEGQDRYRVAVVRLVSFAVDKLNDKAVYANTLVFSGRIFALAFFRIAGVALKLLRALPPVKRLSLRRILQEAGVDENALPPAPTHVFPAHLSDLCLRDFHAYASLLLLPKQMSENVDVLVNEGDITIELTGNWLIRWTASDSDLPFAFYRAYHRQLATYLVPFNARAEAAGLAPVSPAAVVTAPGFLFLAASLLDKSDSLVHRNLRSVTSIGPTSGSFNTNDSANLSFGQKPKVLELAHRRIVQTMVDIAGGPPSPPPGDADVAPDAGARRYVFSGMLQVWIRACVKRTSMWDVRSVFLVLDLVEGLLWALAYTTAARGSQDDETPVPKPDDRGLRLFDIPFLFDVVRIVFTKADNTVSILRVVSFCYSLWDSLTLNVEHRKALCELILDETVFQRLLLHWNSGVRGYYIRLLVWRLSRLGAVAQEQNPQSKPDEGIVPIFNLLNVRLEAIRKRHDQLEPVDNLSDDNAFFRPKRSTICSTRGVKEAPWTVDELAEPLEEEPESDEQSQELMRSNPPSVHNGVGSASSLNGKKGDSKAMSKVVSWLKGGRGKKQGGKSSRPAPISTESRIDPFVLERTDSNSSRRTGVSASSLSQEGPATPLPTTIETGLVPSDASPAAIDGNLLSPPVSPNRPNEPTPTRSVSSRSEKRRSHSPAFFSFEFENGVVTRSDVDPTLASSAASVSSVSTTATSDTTFPTSPIRTRHADVAHAALSPRVSLRFSKRISILPPAALDLLKEVNGVEAVPPIPARFRENVAVGYDKKLHPYAVRGLRDYEDALDEWNDWVAQLAEDDEFVRTRGAFDTAA
ncbi:hypothetical protein Rhopal_004416-T1 [Rhodotorula paludigena]|uniref:Proteophosphoglycan ppg4 n=1 Tax=Rhodotorula paludigena TaxID=86838 RepID=A0AAV5GPE5_9BASI|nr:hypothetical protein Rhopal_004416-T1 [Rhodotorula paludigena]